LFKVEQLLANFGAVIGIRGRSESRIVVDEHAAIVVGADGTNSLVARQVKSPMYYVEPRATCYAYSYWSGVTPGNGEIHFRNDRAATVFPTNDGLTCLTTVWRAPETQAIRHDVKGGYLEAIGFFPRLRPYLDCGRQEERVYSYFAQFPNFYRKPFGPGWALVGDAGYHKDPITALGITDAFRDAELLADAIERGLSGKRDLGQSLAAYERLRNKASLPLYKFTIEISSLGQKRSTKRLVGSDRTSAGRALYLSRELAALKR